jgi:FkbM family methyltransferase
MRPPLKVTAASKAAIRRVVWRAGYDVVPLASSFAQVQQSLLATADLLLDVGANTGQFAERVRAAGYTGQLISFEPSSGPFNVLETRSSGDPQWGARKLALGAEKSSLELNVSANTKSSSLLPIMDRHVTAAPASAVVEHETVAVSTLDIELAKVSFSRGFLKLDVQGYELEVLKGAETTLESTIGVQCELSVVPLYDGQADYLEVIGYLRQHGLHLLHLEPEFQDPHTGAVLQLEALFGRG